MDIRNLTGYEPFRGDEGLLWGIKTVRYPDTLGAGMYLFVCENGEQRELEAEDPEYTRRLNDEQRRHFLRLAMKIYPTP